MFITVTNEIKISTLIIVDTHSMGNTKRKENLKKKKIPKLTARTNLKTLFQGITLWLD